MEKFPLISSGQDTALPKGNQASEVKKLQREVARCSRALDWYMFRMRKCPKYRTSREHWDAIERLNNRRATFLVQLELITKFNLVA